MNISGFEVVAGGIGLVQSHVLHRRSLDHTTNLHKEEIHLLKNQHAQQFRTTKQLYLMQSVTDMEQHFQQLNADLLQSCKELEKDMIDQKILWCQTLIIAATIMFSALTAVLIQGVLYPGNFSNQLSKHKVTYIFYSISNAASLGLLFISILVQVQVVHRINLFSISRSKRHTQFLKNVLTKKKSTIVDFRQQKKTQNEVDLELNHQINFEENVLPWREKVNSLTKHLFTQNHFEGYWNAKCQSLDKTAKVTFYSGTYLMLSAVLIFMRWHSIQQDESENASLTAMVVILFSMSVGLFFLIANLRKYDD